MATPPFYYADGHIHEPRQNPDAIAGRGDAPGGLRQPDALPRTGDSAGVELVRFVHPAGRRAAERTADWGVAGFAPAADSADHARGKLFGSAGAGAFRSAAIQPDRDEPGRGRDERGATGARNQSGGAERTGRGAGVRLPRSEEFREAQSGDGNRADFPV